MGLLEICYLPGKEFPPCPKEIPLEIYRPIVKSMMKKRLLKLTYIKESYELSRRRVIPEALVWRDGHWYLRPSACCAASGAHSGWTAWSRRRNVRRSVTGPESAKR